jgi:hypothetical protein
VSTVIFSWKFFKEKKRKYIYWGLFIMSVDSQWPNDEEVACPLSLLGGWSGVCRVSLFMPLLACSFSNDQTKEVTVMVSAHVVMRRESG